MPHPTSLPAWLALEAHYRTIRNQSMRDWFAAAQDQSPTRAQRFTLEGGGLTLDFSKNRITDQTLQLLFQLARESGVEKQRDAMFAGAIVNTTEQRPALHTALRARTTDTPYANQIQREHAKMAAFAEQIRTGQWLGHSGKPIRHIVNLGIGGSDLGPKMVCEALKHLGHEQLSMHFVTNVDGTDLQRVLSQIDAETTLVIIVSKTFTTLETLTNARSMRRWLIDNGMPEAKLAQHCVGVSANANEAVQFGIAPENVFAMWEWVGGRYSLWSAAGLAIMLLLGPAHFDELLAGARLMDEHFCTVPLERNLPTILGLLGIWYRNFFNFSTQLITPYAHALRYLPAYLQQLEMESNGKSVDVNGERIGHSTAAVLWGEAGTNGQHAFFQMLHQGTNIVPIDFIVALSPEHPYLDHHLKLLANCFAQSEALMRGRTQEEATRLVGPEKAELAPHLMFAGNRPSNTIVLDALTPHSLGALIALYEHKVFVQATVWNINPFDQWGVELGKTLSKEIEQTLADPVASLAHHDSSTCALIARAQAKLATLNHR